MVYNFFSKKDSGSGTKNNNVSNKDLVEEVNKPTIRKFKKITLISYRQFFGC